MQRFFPSFLVTSFLSLGSAWAADGALSLERVTGIVEAWSAEQHLYVKGEVNLDTRQAGELEQWLDQNATNWTVVLVNTARGESYQGKRGIDAVEAIMETELLGTTGFGELRSPKTGDLFGAFFVIYLQERKFSYFGGDHYEDRGLGGNRFVGNLDSAAIRAMRNGGRVANAVRGTIELIDGKLARKLQQQRRSQQAAQAAKEARRRDVQVAIAAGERSLQELGSALEEFRQRKGVLTGDIAQTNTLIWQESFRQAKSSLANGEVALAGQLAESARGEIRARSNLLRDYDSTGVLLKEIERQLLELKLHPHHEGGEETRQFLLEKLAAAKEAHQQGLSYYYSRAENLSQLLVSLVQSDEFAAEEYQREIERAAGEKKQQEIVLTAIGGSTGGLLLLGGVYGNRRRRSAKEKAEALLKQRREEMREVSDDLFDLIDWAALVVGPTDQLEERGYQGQTLEVSQRGLAAVDRAFVISSHVQDLIEKGARLIEPGNPIGGARNLVSQGAYQEAIELLDSEVVCQPGSPPPLPDSAQARKLERLGSSDGEEFTLELPHWQARLQAALNEGKAALEEVDQAWSTVVERRERLQVAIIQLKYLEGKIDDWVADGWLQFDALFTRWIPKMEEEQMAGAELAQGDPVAALNGPIFAGERMAGEAEALIVGVVDFREQRWERVLEQERGLESLDRHTVWLNREMDEFTQEGEDLCVAGCKESVAGRVELLSSALKVFADRVEQSHQQAERAEKKVKVELASASGLVSKTRESLGRRLKVASDLVLKEDEGRNPDEHLAEGRVQREAALAAIDNGEAMAAEAFLDEAERLVASARSLVQESEEIFKVFPQRHRELTTAHQRADEHTKSVEGVVESLRKNYSSSALLVNREESDGANYAHAPVLLESASADVVGYLDEAQKGFQSARLLEARAFLNISEQGVADREGLCAEVEARREELAVLEKENSLLLEQLKRECEDLTEPVADRRVMAATVTLFMEVEGLRDTAMEETLATGTANDPYQAASSLANLKERLSIVRGEVTNDLEVYQNTLLSMKQARAAESKAKALVRAGQNDGVTDSGRLQSAMGQVEVSSQKLSGVEGTLESNHGDWRLVGGELGGIRSELAEASVAIREELKLAREAMTRVSQAEGQLRAAMSWRGRYGVRVGGSPGLMAIESANRSILSGHYHDCIRHAGFAIAEARRAIAVAEAEEARRRRNAEAAERARRAAARRSRMSSSSSRSSFGSRSSFSSSSRVGRSSFSSSSRVGRSGW